jgi:hypothetical protein
VQKWGMASALEAFWSNSKIGLFIIFQPGRAGTADPLSYREFVMLLLDKLEMALLKRGWNISTRETGRQLR